MKEMIQARLYKTLFLAALVGGSQQLLAQQSLNIRNRIVNFQSYTSNKSVISLQASASNLRLVYLKFNAVPDRAILSSMGIALQDYVGDNTFTAILQNNLSSGISNLNAWAPVLAQDKISQYFDVSNTNAVAKVIVSLAKNGDTSIFTNLGINLQAEQPWKSQNKWIASLPTSQLLGLAEQATVLDISPKLEDQALNDQAIDRANAAYAQSPQGFGLTGEGIVLGVGDDSYTTHVDIVDRTKNFNPALNTNHGIHTAGTVAGAGIVNESYTGFATKANVVTNYFSNIIAYAPDYEANFNMKITNNSYAAIVGNCGYAGTYDATSQYLDQQALDHPELLNVFAAGNDGWMTCNPFPEGYATVVGSYQAAKNTLVVGLTGKYSDHINTWTGRGPVKDGRLKPEIVAVGHQIISDGFDNGYAQQSGTSMASPNVAGAAALLQQRFKTNNGGQYPSSALLKAVIMNSASEIGNPGPDFGTGFGMLNVGEAIKVIDNNRYLQSSINHAAQQIHNINVPANVGQLKIMLYWNDAPASPSNAKALVNDLDLVVNSPSSGVYLPLVLNQDPANVLDNAVPGVDHLNNVEQVTINNPDAGTYQINVSGYNIPTGNQSYYITYTFVDKGISITYPVKGSKIEADTPAILHWEALDDNGAFTVEYSTNNGSSWSPVTTMAADKRYALFTPPAGTVSDQCRIRVIRGSETMTTDVFSIMDRPEIVLSSSQCPGNIQIEWSALTGISKYYIYKKIGAEMIIVDSTSATNYTYSGLNMDTTYWVSVSAAINQTKGIRAVALSRKPDNGDCAAIAHHGDLSLLKAILPKSGRVNTSTALSSNTTLSLLARNNDNVINTSYQIDYKINNGSWQTHNMPSTLIPVGGQTTINIPGLNFSGIGTYDIVAVIKNNNVADPIAANDTIKFTVQQLPNDPIVLTSPLVEDFENVPLINSSNAIIGIANASRFDFENSTATGRLRSFVLSEVLIGNNKSISMDNSLNQKNDLQGSSFNTLTGTYNLTNFNLATDEVRFEFDYRLHGKPSFDTANKVFVRGSDTHPWIALPIFDTNSIGVVNNYGAHSLRDYFLANNQPFSTSAQIKIMQRDITMIGGAAYGRGLTVDNIKLFKAENDIALIEAKNINKFNCGLNNSVPLTVSVANTMPQNLSNIPIFYQVDNQPIVSEIIASINAKDTIDYTFTQTMDLSNLGAHNIRVWLAFTGDNYPGNDTLKNIEIHHQPLVNSYPYLEGFENNNGYYFGDGVNSSWEYGSPNSIGINRAANGSKAWKTSINGSYSPNEASYLYSPCFDLSSLTNPMLSFSFFREIENPGDEVFDSAYVEYSIDGGQNWLKLGLYGQGYNWYNLETNAWTGTENKFWSVSSIGLPQSSSLSLRWVMHSDVGAQFAGLGLDDVHIFDYQKPIFDEDSFATALTANINATTNFGTGTHISGVVDPLSQNLGSSSFQSYKHINYISPDSQQLYLPRSFALKTNTPVTSDSVQLSLYVKDSLMKVVRNSTQCNACTSHPVDIYQLGVTTYVESNNANVNGNLEDDLTGDFTFIPNEKVTWVPYFDGYYAIFKTNQMGEYWFNDGGITGANPLPNHTLVFEAFKTGDRSARITWKNNLDAAALNYQLQADEGEGFKPIWNTTTIGNGSHEYAFADTPSVALSPNTFYRLRYTNRDGRILLSPIRKLTWDDLPVSFEVYPNPTHDGAINFSWYNNGAESFKWGVYAVTGQQVAAGTVDQNRFAGTEKVQLKDFAQIGNVFILKVQYNNETRSFKIIYHPN